ncbi:helix-turn-helix transcriptional regulator [Paenibacillus mendelii]|uniref:Helix-turn-helix transcriptional regulator n=1 Tax=Paenibacillus mendelii TaxID=206163 RepID=A0ABV6J5E0_9BACL|nr:YafY family protein [Paenibacillus mendelii]MCQ6560211.1 YafY family transcriptional regulator [Paenibacillus mendelii]
MSKADNMLAILGLLQSRRRMTAKQLAEALEIHIRTVYRCVDALCIAGVPIVSEIGRDGGYLIPDNIKLEPLFFDADEQKALLQAAAFAKEAGYPSESALSRAIAKIKRYTNPEQLQRMEHYETSIEVIQPPSVPALTSLLAEIETGMEQQSSLELNYKAGYDGVQSKRILDPYGLVHWKSKWYAVGYCHLRGEIRSFRVDRMSDIRCTDNKYQRPQPFSARDFLLSSLLPESGSDHDMISVRIQGTPQALDDLCRHWLLGHALVERTVDQAHFRLDEETLYSQLSYYLLSFGGKIRIVEPEELKSCLIDITASLLDYYQS